MHRISKEDLDFEFLEALFHQAKDIGSFGEGNSLRQVKATERLVLVTSNGEHPEFIAVQPARNLSEAESLALSLLWEARRKGNTVIFELD